MFRVDEDDVEHTKMTALQQEHTSTVLGVDVVGLAGCHVQAEADSNRRMDSLQAIQSAHRLRLIEAWLFDDAGTKDISPLMGNVLEIGCGQGDQTGALAAFMAQTPELRHSLVHGADPGPPDYGAPFTLAQAQTHLINSTLKPHIRFEPRSFADQALARHPAGHFTSLVVSACLWYFSSEQQVVQAFEAAHAHGVRYMLLAEWALHASSPAAMPHLLAALLQDQAPVEQGNIRLLLDPDTIKRLARQAGWRLASERTIVPAKALHDGRWETGAAMAEARSFLDGQPQQQGQDNKKRCTVEAMLYALQHCLPDDQLFQVQSMDMWTAVMVRQ